MRWQVAFTLIEVMVVFAIIAVLSSVAFLTIKPESDPAKDMAARASLVQADSLQSARGDGPITDLATLGALDPSRIWTTGASLGPDTVSIAVDPSDPAVLSAAVSTGGGSCWMLRRDFDAPSAAERALWVVADDELTCDAARALNLQPDPTGQSGTSASKPKQL